MKEYNTKRFKVHISFFGIVVFFIYAMVVFTRQQAFIRKQEIREQDLTREKIIVESELEALEKRLEHVGTDEYVEQVARQRLGWVMQDEVKFVNIGD